MEKNIKNDERQQEKMALTQYLTGALERVSTKEEFLDELHNNGYEPYYRNGKLQGCKAEDRRFRFSTLGIKEQIDILESARPSEKIFEKPKEEAWRDAMQREDAAWKEFHEMMAPDDNKTHTAKEELQKGQETGTPEKERNRIVFDIDKELLGLSEEDRRERLQELQNENLAFEERHGISRDTESPNKDGAGPFDYGILYDGLVEDLREEFSPLSSGRTAEEVVDDRLVQEKMDEMEAIQATPTFMETELYFLEREEEMLAQGRSYGQSWDDMAMENDVRDEGDRAEDDEERQLRELDDLRNEKDARERDEERDIDNDDDRSR